jgi:hypothetical protein
MYLRNALQIIYLLSSIMVPLTLCLSLRCFLPEKNKTSGPPPRRANPRRKSEECERAANSERQSPQPFAPPPTRRTVPVNNRFRQV